jgi:hypothetical protein
MTRRSVVLTALCAFAAPAAFALECARGNAPAATLLVPYFRVSRNGATTASPAIPDVIAQTDTLLSVTNVSDTGVLVRVTVWSKYGVPVLGFNVAMTAKDVMTFRMKDVLNGHLNVNPTTQRTKPEKDPCGLNQTSGVYAPRVGVGATTYVRFANPDADDAKQGISVYVDPALSPAYRTLIWDSLDESGDLREMAAPGAFVLDDDNASCGDAVDGVLAGDFSGSVTIDVVNYCSNHFHVNREFWANQVIATAGWGPDGPNVLIGDVFYVDSTDGGNISGDPMVALRYDRTLGGWNGPKTFYGRYESLRDTMNLGVPPEYRFVGDGREALGTRYAFRYLSDSRHGLRSWALSYRTDRYASGANDLCAWSAAGGTAGGGGRDGDHELYIRTFDADGNEFVQTCGGGFCPEPFHWYFFLESQRIDLLDNPDVNPGGLRGGWMDIAVHGSRYVQGFLGVQHGAAAELLSVGHAASVLDPEACGP